MQGRVIMEVATVVVEVVSTDVAVEVAGISDV
jgi:hypothetical protein